MSAAQESIPPATGRGGSRGGGSSRGRGGSSRGGGRRANFGGSLTGDASNSNNGGNNNNNRTRNNQSRGPRPPRNQNAQSQSQHASTAAEEQPSTSTAVATAPTTTEAPAATTATAAADDDDNELPPEGEICFICADPIKLHSVAPCDHRTCHICALRLRVLYKKDECTFCKTKIPHLIFTSSSTKPYSSFTPSDTPFTDRKLPISFETKEALEETVLLLRFNCPDPNCEVACTGWKDYKAHVRREHNRLVCQLCITNKKIFAHEHTLHTEQSLAAHEKEEHRLCEYDRLLFYSDEELFSHMRDRHEQCHICKARGGEEERWKYYRDYDMLEKHFRRDHWLCENKDCLADRFVVFGDEVDFKAHKVEKHANELSTRERREAVRIEANFSYDDGGESSRAGGSGFNRSGGNKKSKGKGNGDAPVENRDVLGVSQLASRAHVPGAGPANHASRRAMFGSGLTNPTASPQGLPSDRPRTVTDTRSIEERHQSYMDKASSALGSESRITTFRHAIRLFKAGESSPRDLISTIHSLVGEMDDSAPLVLGLVDLLDDKEKAASLSDAWAGYRVERTQFPSLVPQTSTSGITPGSGYAGAGSRGNLRNIKKASSAGSQVWANVERAASSSSGHGSGKPVALREHFPSLNTGGGSSGSTSIPGSLAHAVAHNAANRSGGAKWNSTPNTNTMTSSITGATVPKPYVAKVQAVSIGGGKSVNTTSKSAFPSLPTNANAKALNAHKKALFANRNVGGSGNRSPTSVGMSVGGTPAGGSGSSTPWLVGQQPGRIDDFPDLDSGNRGNLDGLSERLVATGLESGNGGNGGNGGGTGKGKKKGKGVQMLSFGGVHRG